MFSPTDIANEALDAAGLEYTLGDLEDGNRYAQVCARRYRPCLAALLRSARWQFARKQQPLQFLGDTTGQYTSSTIVVPPWIYEYALPNDCVQAHYVPQQPGTQMAPIPQGNIAIPSTPLTSATYTNNWAGRRLVPTRFLITRDVNYPPQPGSEWWEVQGQSPMGQTVVLSNVPCATLVYTSLVLYPNEWDVSFREAMVAYLASEIVLPLTKDKKLGMALRRDQIAIVKERVNQARISDGNEYWSVNDHTPEWISFRNVGNGRGWFGGGSGYGDGGFLYQGYSSLALGDGTAY